MSEINPVLITAKEVAQYLSVSERTVWRLKSAGRLPQSVELGGSVRWIASEFLKWVERGCPNLTPRRGA